MNRSKIASITLALAVALPSFANAQATRTWVSGVGDDVNPCSRTAPCKTFAGAISKTATGGEISVLDPGGFGQVSVTKSITISGDGTLASIVAGAGNGINVNAGPGGVVVLRNLSLVSNGTATNAISYTSGATLVVENVTISGFLQSGIVVTSAGNLAVKNTSITGGTTGVQLNGGGKASLIDVSIKGAGTAIDVLSSIADVSNSVLTQNSGFALLVEGGSLTAENVMITGNGVGAQVTTGAVLRLSNCSLYNNLSGFGCGGGTIASAGNNRKGGNTGGVVPTCGPNAAITVQ